MGRGQRKQAHHRQVETPEPWPAVPWTLSAVVGVYVCAFVGMVGAGILGRRVAPDTSLDLVLTRYIGGLVGLCLPIGYVWKRYGLPPAALGLKRGKLRPMVSVALGIGLAITYFFLVRIYLFRYPIGLSTNLSSLAFAVVVVPLSLHGFAAIFLAPLSEEVLDRGFLYAYLRTTLGRWPALLLQAVLFSGLHIGSWNYSNLSYAIDMFAIGLMLGFLYEKTESLYPSMVCHGTVSYLALLYPMFSGEP
jgi:CAAX protease family protein